MTSTRPRPGEHGANEAGVVLAVHRPLREHERLTGELVVEAAQLRKVRIGAVEVGPDPVDVRAARPEDAWTVRGDVRATGVLRNPQERQFGVRKVRGASDPPLQRWQAQPAQVAVDPPDRAAPKD